MKKVRVLSVFLGLVICSFTIGRQHTTYHNDYLASVNSFKSTQQELADIIKNTDCSGEAGKKTIKDGIEKTRTQLKAVDFWLRYFEPVAYNQVNGPLPVEWENEVFEKFEKPYRREGGGLTLAELYLRERTLNKDTLLHLIQMSLTAVNTFQADSITNQLDTFDHFFFANRLYLLNLAAVYTTGFECPDSKNIIPELRTMIAAVRNIYGSYNRSFPATPLPAKYLELYDKMAGYVATQPADYAFFDHYTFIKDYVNPLFAINQSLIITYGAASNSLNDYTLNNDATSVFDKKLYSPQNAKGIFSLVKDTATLSEIKHIGKLLFYDPILSGNNRRSCISCHRSTQYFTDTTACTSMQFNEKDRLPRNTPSLVNVIYNHLLMMDGKHISLQAQGKAVMTNPIEMGGTQDEILAKVLSCKEYKTAFKKFLAFTPEEEKISFEHIVAAVTFYYADFSNFYSPFDDAMNATPKAEKQPVSREAINGFNLFMGKAKCGTCHFVPQFNGVKPPYISTEFEVLGVPADNGCHKMSDDKGRYEVNPAYETMNAFRTGSIRNAQYTAPYMHNGVFSTLEQVIDFYDAGGGAGKNFIVANQTLSRDSLKLTPTEKKELISFIHSLNEKIIFQAPPVKLPPSSNARLNNRKVGGEY